MAAARPRPGHRAPTAAERAGSWLTNGVRAVPRPLALAVVSGALVAGAAVAGGATSGEPAPAPQLPQAAASEPEDSQTREAGRIGRSSERPSLAQLKADALADDTTGAGRHEGSTEVSREALATSGSDPRDIARAMLPQYGWSASEFSCLDRLWVGESDWKWNADNPTSSAYGIPQSLPGSKMADVAPDWRTNPETQITWGLAYIAARYGNPQGAWGHSQRVGWY